MTKKPLSKYFSIYRILGIFVIFLGVFLPMVIKFVFDLNQISSSTNRVILLIFQLILILLGILLLFIRDPKKSIKKLIFRTILGILLLLFLESGLQVANLIFNFRISESERYLKHPAFDGHEWAESLFKEFDSLKIVFSPYTIWRRSEFTGEHINIDNLGIRKTWNPSNRDKEEVKKIYIFGGSALWGTGARDDFTIPSFLSKRLNNQGIPCDITNYGESGYIFTQEIVKLVLLLNEGYRPDVVLFYDGFNDVYSAYSYGKPDTIHDLEDITRRFSGRKLKLNINKMITKAKEGSFLYDAIDKIVYAISKEKQFKERGARYSDERLSELAEDIVQNYLQTMMTLEKLSETYGFTYLCFWQPVLYLEEKVFEAEKQADPRIQDTAFSKLYKEVDRIITREANTNLIQLKTALSERTFPCYLDLCHLCEAGNDLIVQMISLSVSTMME